MSDFDSLFSDLKLPLYGVRLPEFSIEDRLKKAHGLKEDASSYDFILQVCRTNFKKLNIPKDQYSKYSDRVKYELETIKELGFLDYIVLVWSVINYCDENSIPVGLGRGSAAGSLILYLLGVTKVDPIRYELFFERFISKIRSKKQVVDGITYLDGSLICDVDLDICYYNRNRVIKFLEERFSGKTCKILTLTTLSGKILIKECGKIIDNKPETEMNEVSSLIPKVFGQIKDLKEAYGEVPEFQKWCDANPRSYKTALKLRGLIKNKSVHASGMMLSYHPIAESCPTELTSDKERVSSYDMNWVSVFNVKLDLLGLRSVSVVSRVCELVKIKKEDIDFNDSFIYQQLHDLKYPHGIFQIEAGTNFSVCKKVKPKNLEELSGVLALARPGALEFVDQYANYTNTGSYESVHPFFDSVLKDSGGVCLAEGTKIVNADTGFEFSIENEAECLGSTVFSLDQDNNLTKSKITNWYHNGKKQVFKISFDYKLSTIEATDNHKFLTLNGWRELKDLKVGDYVAEPSHLCSSGRKSFDKHKLAALGYLLSDGSLTNGSSVCFVSKDDRLLKKYKQSVQLGFANTAIGELTQIRDVTRITSRKKTGKYHQPSDLLLWLRDLKLKTDNGGCDSYEKFIPNFIFGLDKESISVFLAALFDGDGMSLKETFNYKTVSRQLASDLQKLLLRIGFQSKVYGNSISGYNITVESPSAFFNQVGKYFERENLSRFKNNFGTTRRVFPLNYLLEEIRKEGVHIIKRALARDTGISRSTLKFKQKFISESVFRAIAEYYGLTSALMSLNTNWASIKSISASGHKDVYDVSVEDTHNFVANSVFAHNCAYQEQLMKMSNKIGFTLDEAEVLRRIVGKKKVEEVKKWKEKISDKIKENNLDPEIGDILWRILENSANYSFNKCAFEEELVEEKSRGKIMLKDVQIGDMVKAYDIDKDVNHFVEVLDVMANERKLHEITLEDGRTLKISLEHKLLCGDKVMRPLEEIIGNGYSVLTDQPYSEAVVATVKKQNIVSIRPVSVKKTIDLEVNHKDHNFYAGGFVSSNSHSVSYSALAATTVYLKFKYPKEFFLALLEMTKHEPAPLQEISKIQKELRHFGIKLLGPHILKSETDFSIQGNDIRYGLSSIKGISEKTMEKLNNFKSEHSNKFEVFEAAKEVRLPIGVTSALIQAGALDGFSSSRSRVVLEAQLWNILTENEKILSIQHGPNHDFDLLKVVKSLSETKNENGKLLIKESRLATIKKKYDPYLKIYQQNNKSESFANWYYENKLLGYSYDKCLKDIFVSKMPNLKNTSEVFEGGGGSVYLIGKVDEASEFVARNEKKTKTFKMMVSDEMGSCAVLMFNDKIDVAKSENEGKLPEEGDIVIIKGSKKTDCIFAETVVIQTLKIYTKLSELTEKSLDDEAK